MLPWAMRWRWQPRSWSNHGSGCIRAWARTSPSARSSWVSHCCAATLFAASSSAGALVHVAADPCGEAGRQAASSLYTVPLPSTFSEAMGRPSFFFSAPEIMPRTEPPRVYRRAKLQENCPLWHRKKSSKPYSPELRERAVRLLMEHRADCEQSGGWLRSQANLGVRRTAFALGSGRPSAMAASGLDRPVPGRCGSKSLSVRCANSGRPMRF